MENTGINREKLVKFGKTMGIAFLVIAVFVFIRHRHNPLPLVIIAVIFLSLARIAPGLLKTCYIIWMKFALALSWVNTRLILAIIFYLLFAPISLVLRLFRIDLLERRIDKQKATYWKINSTGPSDYERQF